jgi:hypothetical protein
MRNASGSTLPVPDRAEGKSSSRSIEQLLSIADFYSLRDLTRSSNPLGMLPNPTVEMAEAAVSNRVPIVFLVDASNRSP